MSEPLNDTDTVQPLYATMFVGPRNEPRVQVTLVEGVSVHNIGQNAYKADAAYVDVSLDYFRAWLREINASLAQLNDQAAGPTTAPEKGQGQ